MQLQQGKQFAKSSLLRKCGLLAHTSAAFLKNCWSKKLFVCLRLVIGNTSLRFLFHLTVQFHLLRKRGLLAHTSAAFLKNCCTEKLFSRLRLVAYSHLYYFKNSRSCDSNSARTAP